MYGWGGLVGGMQVVRVIPPGSQGSGPVAWQWVRSYMGGCLVATLWAVAGMVSNDSWADDVLGRCPDLSAPGSAAEVGVEGGVGGGFRSGVACECATGRRWLS